LLQTIADVDYLTAERNPEASYEQITDGAAIQMEADDIDAMGAEYR